MATMPSTCASSSSLFLLLRRDRRSRSASLPGPARRLGAVRASAKEIAFDQGSRSSLQAGVEKLAAAVAVTLGPRGSYFLTLSSNTSRCTPFVP
uniref:Uncharacterized protein n=1 Tax=Oryza meridionalis TaxID=40149 RepID=A0A0E0D0G5_9ORYZ